MASHDTTVVEVVKKLQNSGSENDNEGEDDLDGYLKVRLRGGREMENSGEQDNRIVIIKTAVSQQQ